jgi:hypothetical protein
VDHCVCTGGRFDATEDDPYPTYYGGLTPSTALAEVFLRDVPFDERTVVRTIRRKQVAHQRSSVVETTTELSLVSLLDAAALAAVAATEWLIHIDRSGYPDTRRWASWIRRQAPLAQGLIWPSKRHTGAAAMVLFGDRCPGNALSAQAASRIHLDDEIGAEWINAMLAPCRARIMPPPSRRQTSP